MTNNVRSDNAEHFQFSEIAQSRRKKTQTNYEMEFGAERQVAEISGPHRGRWGHDNWRVMRLRCHDIGDGVDFLAKDHNVMVSGSGCVDGRANGQCFLAREHRYGLKHETEMPILDICSHAQNLAVELCSENIDEKSRAFSPLHAFFAKNFCVPLKCAEG